MKASEVIKIEIANCGLSSPTKIRKHLIEKFGLEVPVLRINHIQAELIGQKQYIITKEPVEQFNCKNESLGMSEKSAIFYSPSVGRKRYYRNSLHNPNKGLKLLTFRKIQSAQRVCDITNALFKSNYKVEELTNVIN